MKKILIFAIIIFLSSSVRVFLMGGNMSDNETTVYEALASSTSRKPDLNQCSSNWDSTTCPRIAVVTSAAPSSQDGDDAFNNDTPTSLSYQNLFMKYGLSPKHVTVHIDNYQTAANHSTPEGRQNLEIISKADIIFFNGGDQARHSRSWLNDDGEPNDLFKIIIKKKNDDSAVFAGTSAGTMAMSNLTYGGGISYGHLYFSYAVGLAPKKVSDGQKGGTGLMDNRNGTKGIQYEDNGGTIPGFGFVKMLIDTHFDARGRLGRLIPGMIHTKKSMGLGIDESTCLYFNNGMSQVFGKGGVFIADISKGMQNKSLKYFNIKQVSLWYLTIGDKFDFLNKALTTEKSLIKQPRYSGYTDSSDIFSKYECTLLMNRLVDQTGKYNMGYARIPSGYPDYSPVFNMKFYPSSNTKGYYNKQTKQYAVQNALIDIGFG